MTPEQRRARAVAVRELLDNPLTKEAFAAIEEDLTAEWKRAFDTHERENLWRAVNMIERVKTWMNSAASHDLASIRRAK